MRTVFVLLVCSTSIWAEQPEIVPVAENEKSQVLTRLETFLKMVEQKKAPWKPEKLAAARKALIARDTRQVQESLDPLTLAIVNINPEGRVKLQGGPLELILQQNQTGYALLKIVNLSGGQPQLELQTQYTGGKPSPFTIDLTPGNLAGVIVEYQLCQIRCSEAGQREITIAIQAGQGTQDLGFRGELPLLFTIKK